MLKSFNYYFAVCYGGFGKIIAEVVFCVQHVVLYLKHNKANRFTPGAANIMDTRTEYSDEINVGDSQFAHLDPKIKFALGLSDKERILLARKVRFFSYPAAKEIMAELETMLEPTEKQRVPGMVITADPNNGKSALVRQFAKKHPVQERKDGTGIDIPVLLIDGPPKADVGWLLSEILSALNVPYKHKADDETKFRQIRAVFERLNVRMLIIDEISDIVSGSASNQRYVLTTIKQAATRTKIPIILTGTAPIISAISTDDQTKSRFTHRELPNWNADKDFIDLLAAVERHIPLKLPSHLSSKENRGIADKILQKSEGRIGWIIEILEKAAEKAILGKEERIAESIIDSINL